MLLSINNTTVAAYLNKRVGGGGQVSNLIVHGNQAASIVCEATGVSQPNSFREN